MPMNETRPHTVLTDPGTEWVKDELIAIDVPPDAETAPTADGQWPAAAIRSGLHSCVAPTVVEVPSGGYRMYNTHVAPRPDCPEGANDYKNATARILSATSIDGSTWHPEAGSNQTSAVARAHRIRLGRMNSPQDPGYYKFAPNSKN